MIITDQTTLHKVSALCPAADAEDVFKLLETEFDLQPNAAGLAAIQIGIPKRCFVYLGECENMECQTCKNTEHPKKHLFRVLNPTINEYCGIKFISSEGCLSLPGKQYRVYRYQQIVVTDDIGGKQILTDHDAVVFQHEYDHTCGKLISDNPVTASPGRNDACPCGSGKKFKKCCGK